MANLPTLAQRCAELHPYVAPIVAPGLSYTAGLIWSGVSLVIGFVTGWYVKGRGMEGIKIDLNNAKLDIAKIKGKLDGNPNTSNQTPDQTTPGISVSTNPGTPIILG